MPKIEKVRKAHGIRLEHQKETMFVVCLSLVLFFFHFHGKSLFMPNDIKAVLTFFMAGSINYHRTKSSNIYEIRFVIFWLLFGSKCKFVQSCSSLHSFTLLHFDLKNKLKI